MGRRWAALSVAEKRAAAVLGYRERAWEAELDALNAHGGGKAPQKAKAAKKGAEDERRRAEEGLKRKLSGVQSLWYNVTVRDIVQGFAEMKQLRSADYASKMSELERKNQTASMRLQGMLDEVHERA